MEPKDDLAKETEKERRFQELKAAIEHAAAQVDRGEIFSEEEVFTELFSDDDLQDELAPALEQLYRGEGVDGPTVMARLQARLIKAKQLKELKSAIAEGIASLDRGEGVDGETFFDELLADIDNPPNPRKPRCQK